jgi:hypothetical protein
MNTQRNGHDEPGFTLELLTDPERVQRARAREERGKRNDAWLQGHWADLLPRARGKFVAVAGEEGFVADTAAEAWAWVERAHPEDDGAIVQYVRTEQGPRIYAHTR